MNEREAAEPRLSAEEEARWERECADLRAENEARKRAGERPGLLTIDDARTYTGRSRGEVLRAIDDGELKAIRFVRKGTGRGRFTKAALDAWMARRTATSCAAGIVREPEDRSWLTSSKTTLVGGKMP